jgi:hypothetical protein
VAARAATEEIATAKAGTRTTTFEQQQQYQQQQESQELPYPSQKS